MLIPEYMVAPLTGGGLKVAVTFLSASMVTVQVAPLQPDTLQPAKVEPPLGCAVRVTVAPLT